jgi:hypothetical protein
LQNDFEFAETAYFLNPNSVFGFFFAKIKKVLQLFGKKVLYLGCAGDVMTEYV